jgi:precorrin-6A synthase (deacetylating)
MGLMFDPSVERRPLPALPRPEEVFLSWLMALPKAIDPALAADAEILRLNRYRVRIQGRLACWLSLRRFVNPCKYPAIIRERNEAQGVHHRHRGRQPGFRHRPGHQRDEQVDVFFIPNKGIEKEDLARVRLEIIERYVRDRPFRTVAFKAPERERGPDGYEAAVSDWHDRVEEEYGKLIMEELDASETGAFLVWGDPTLYDSTMRILDRLRARGDFELEYEVLPGISSVQVLAARHKVALCNIGRGILISTGRSMAAEGFPNNIDSVVFMLNAEESAACRRRRP